jgi:3,4-dihydroxy-2-butanone 4-phosphate synthase
MSKEQLIEQIAQRDKVRSGLIANKRYLDALASTRIGTVLEELVGLLCWALTRSAAVSLKLRLLHAHGVIRKLPHTLRYVITESERAVLTAIVAAQQADTQKLTLASAAEKNRRKLNDSPWYW